MPEAKITVNGKELTDAQSMTVRCSLNSMVFAMREPYALGSDKHGKAMAKLYLDNLAEIIPLFR